MKNVRDVGQLSNELEFVLYGIEAYRVVEACKLPLIHEINMRDVVELNVPLAKNIPRLNAKVRWLTNRLMRAVHRFGGNLYGGSSVLADTSSLAPMCTRLTSLSKTFGRNLLDITSQQIVLGVTDERFGFELYNLFRNLNPALLALTASSPYLLTRGKLEDSGFLSRRIQQYERMCSYFPEAMLRMIPLSSLDGYSSVLRIISNEINHKLEKDELDADWDELRRIRQNGAEEYSHIPFTYLKPNQIYWFNRIRPDHRTIENGGNSLFSLELRVADLPTTIDRMQMLNSFVGGLAYYVADHGPDNIPTPLNSNFEDLRIAAREGLSGIINGQELWRLAMILGVCAIQGLMERGYPIECELFGKKLEKVLTYGNDAELMRREHFTNPEELRSYLTMRLRKGE